MRAEPGGRDSRDDAAPLAAEDLPLKVLIWEDGTGAVSVSYNSPAYLAERHHLSDELRARLEPIVAICDALVPTLDSRSRVKGTTTERRSAVTEITDDYMLEMRARSKGYTLLVLERGPSYGSAGSDAIIWEHGRRNHALRSDGALPIVCPITDDTDWCGIGIFERTEEETARIMDEDPGVVAGVFTYNLHPIVSFPGDALP